MKIDIDLTARSIESAIKKLRDYENILNWKLDELISRMCGDGVDYAINQVGHVDTGETLNSIQWYSNGVDHGVIVAGGAAIWIEFGTGVYRNPDGAPHPKRSELGMSGIGEFGTKGQQNSWAYLGDDGQIHKTHGIKSNQFMYKTALMLQEKFPELAREVFRSGHNP